MGAAQYRIGPSDFFLPGDLKADADTLLGQANALDGSIDGNEAIPQDSFDQWNLWLTGLRGFYNNTFGGLFGAFSAALNDSNRDALISYENQFQAWVNTFAGDGIKLSTPLIQPSTGAQDNIASQVKNYLGLDLSTVVLWIVVIVVAWFAFKRFA